MRDFRDAKAMAQTLREALGAKSIPLTHSDSLELIAKLFGQRDWNTLAARIQAAGGVPDVPPSAPQSPPDAVRHEIAVATAVLDGYAGFYQLSEQSIFTVTREEQHLVMQLTGQPSVPFFAEGQTEFFARLVDAQVSFVAGPDGRATSLLLHQNGRDMRMMRVDAAKAKEVADRIAERMKSQTATPGTEAALRHLIAGIVSGHPNYDAMSPGLAAATREQLPSLQLSLGDLGAIESTRFLGVGAQGEDVYSVRHENGASHWRIALDTKGIVSTAWVSPGP
ncbi:glyoxalase superfamily protein [Bradyrhizobium mercantei]|uniref:glyoxalase superfamily protein n=1 Tax=Bradyrhizobium mercantei TaxID=1904807 RepID=UPI00097888A2|nr:glyoxalase superfamily protein [Bradyrhizobium mercantei]